MKQKLQQLIHHAVQNLITQQQLALDNIPEIRIDRCKNEKHGDYAANIAMLLARPAKKNPREIAQFIVNEIGNEAGIDKMEIAGPGFINFFIHPAQQYQIIHTVLQQGERFGYNQSAMGKKLLLEFVSANPTGPLHVGHGRGAAYGNSLANVLKANGWQVDCEYYVNDAGRQMDILATSVWLRYLQQQGQPIPFPINAYRGNYIFEIVEILDASKMTPANIEAHIVLADLPPDEDQGGDKEIYIDALIVRAKALLGDTLYQYVHDQAIDYILADIRDDLEQFRVVFDRWYSEKELMHNNRVTQCLQRLQQNGHLYSGTSSDTNETPDTQTPAQKSDKSNLWFAATRFGDDKDRVVQRENGQTTYFASDIAYHLDKYQRGYDRLINIWGADHHGYITRVKAAVQALGLDVQKLDVLLVQFAVLWRDGKKVQMSTRSGSFVTLRELREEAGNDATRFFYVMRKSEQHLDFDLNLAKSRTADNPVYYIQYAHARICSVLRQLGEKALPLAQDVDLTLLNSPHEHKLLTRLSAYPDVVAAAGNKYEPHLIAHFLKDCAADLHAYYNQSQFLVEDIALRSARILLIRAVKQVIHNGLALLGVSAPEHM